MLAGTTQVKVVLLLMVTLVAELARCGEGLFPALLKIGSLYAVVGTVIKEMEVLKSHLETYRGVWDVGGGRE